MDDELFIEPSARPNLSYPDLLKEALRLSEEEGVFSAVRFFTIWLRQWGSVYYFLFRKNHRVTNIQVAELLALLRVNSGFVDQNEKALDLQFLSKSDFTRAVQDITGTFSGPDRYQIVSDKYGELLRRAAVIENYFGSTAVYLPPFLDVQLGAICAQSGYIHSCGEGIYVRNVYKASKTDMFSALKRHLSATASKGQKLFFAVYSHEDFTEWDRILLRTLRDGLDDVKLHLSKMYFENDRIVDVIKEMRSLFRQELVFPDPGDYRVTHPRALSEPDLNHDSSLWLVVDSDLRLIDRLPGDRRFFILYNQRFLNNNPFHECDENKPAWIDHTTIPHTLMGAMINIPRPYWTRDQIMIADPFVGSGTTYFETLKFGDVGCAGGDDNPMCPLVIEDNLRFFAASASDLRQMANEVGEFADHFTDIRPPKRSRTPRAQEIDTYYSEALEFFEQVDTDDGRDFRFSERFSQLIAQAKTPVRTMFYLMLRARRRNTAVLDSGGASWRFLLSSESDELHNQLDRVAKERAVEETGNPNCAINIYQGSHSLACGIGSAYLRNKLSRGEVRAANESMDALDFLRGLRGGCDLIITDPPYGFNTNDNTSKLASLYGDMIHEMISALRDEGQLVFAVPDWSYTGRHLPTYAKKDFVTHQVLVAARELGREVIQTAAQVPRAAGAAAAPYYWVSEKALRRLILHFRFRKSPTRSVQRNLWEIPAQNLTVTRPSV